MNTGLILFTLGIIMVVAGYVNQISPTCDQEIKIKIVPRNVYDEITEQSTFPEEIYNDIS